METGLPLQRCLTIYELATTIYNQFDTHALSAVERLRQKTFSELFEHYDIDSSIM